MGEWERNDDTDPRRAAIDYSPMGCVKDGENEASLEGLSFKLLTKFATDFLLSS